MNAAKNLSQYLSLLGQLSTYEQPPNLKIYILKAVCFIAFTFFV